MCPMQRMVNVFSLTFCGNGSSVLHPGAIRKLDNAGEEGRIVDGCVFSEVPRLVVGDHAGGVEQSGAHHGLALLLRRTKPL